MMVDRNQDIRWKQRFSNYKFALEQLIDAVHLSKTRQLSLLEKQGLIQAFEYTHELAWNVMKDFFQYQGNIRIKGSRDATREAFRYELITDGDIWMDMIQARNLTSHAYDKSMAEKAVKEIINIYVPQFLSFKKVMEQIEKEDV
jgi:nucleotidyltransferase substrate binding protein (TIGR01987 family)